MKLFPEKPSLRKAFILLLLVSFVVRSLLAIFLEFGNDEVYYRLYAMYPDWGHFDHPPMLGYMIQLFTLNLTLDNEFFIRLPAIIGGLVNTWLVFLITRRISNEKAGFTAAMLYTASVYAFIISGTFILPDAPQNTFWLVSLWFFILSFENPLPQKKENSYMLLAGLFSGLAIISKFTSIYLWLGVGLFILFHNRIWLKKPSLYASVIISILCLLPVIYWNWQNHFISFTYQGERVDITQGGFRPDYLFTELGGQFLYNNPLIVILSVAGLIAFLKNRSRFQSKLISLLIWTSLPIIFTFIGFSMFRQTLPHWSAPGYTGLIIITALWMNNWKNEKTTRLWRNFSLILLGIIIIMGFIQIHYGSFIHPKKQEITRKGVHDFSLDLYGWKQAGQKFRIIQDKAIINSEMPANAPIISFRWFPAANLDYYFAKPASTQVLAIGSLERIHKYAWINKDRGGFKKGMDAWFITSSRDYKSPEEYQQYFEQIIPSDTIPVIRSGDTVMYYFIYRLHHLQNIPHDVLDNFSE